MCIGFEGKQTTRKFPSIIVYTSSHPSSSVVMTTLSMYHLIVRFADAQDVNLLCTALLNVRGILGDADILNCARRSFPDAIVSVASRSRKDAVLKNTIQMAIQSKFIPRTTISSG